MKNQPDKRDIMAMQLVLQGYATVDQLLEASYGEWPPKGLDIVGQSKQIVNIISQWEMNKKYSEMENENPIKALFNNVCDVFDVLGKASIHGERNIGINKFSMKELRATLGHELVHIMQGDHYYRAPNVFGKENAQEHLCRQRDMRSNIYAEHLYNVAGKPQEEPSMLKRVFNYFSGNFDFFSSNEAHAQYLQEGIEIQARLHEILIEGYQRWESLPTNQTELLVAMQSAGFDLPAEITDKLEKTPDIEKIRAKFPDTPVGEFEKRAVDGILVAESAVMESGRYAFWMGMMTDMYVDLIEMYGDKEGGKRFGRENNVIGDLRQTEDFAEMQAIHAHNYSVRGMSS